MMWPTVAVLASVTAIVAGVLAWYSKRSLENVRRAEKHRNGFFEAAERVISDTRVSRHLAAFVFILSTGLSNRVLPYALLWSRFVKSSQKTPEDLRKVFEEMDELPDDLKHEVGILAFHGLMVIALQSAIVGGLLANQIEASHQPPDHDQNHCDGGDSLFDRAATFQFKFGPGNPLADGLLTAP